MLDNAGSEILRNVKTKKLELASWNDTYSTLTVIAGTNMIKIMKCAVIKWYLMSYLRQILHNGL